MLLVANSEYEQTGVAVDQHDRFKERLEAFLPQARARCDHVSQLHEQFTHEFRDCAAFFCEDPNTTRPHHFFSLFEHFRVSTIKAAEEVAAGAGKTDVRARGLQQAPPRAKVMPAAQAADVAAVNDLLNNIQVRR